MTPPWLPPFLWVLLFCAAVDFLKILIEIVNRVETRAWTSDPSSVTAVIPSKNGAAVLPKTIESLARLLPPERILVVDDGSTDDTAQVARALGCTVHRFENSLGKAGAINFAIHRVKTPYTLLIDDDTRIGSSDLPTSLLDEGRFDAVAYHVLPDRRNREGARGNNFIGRVQRYEYGKSMEIGRRFHDATKSVSCVSGAIGLFRTADLNELHHKHTGVFQGEDLQRSLIHLMNGREIVFANEPVWTVAPWSWKQWLRQRLWGWYPAIYHNLLNFFRVLFTRKLPLRLKYEMLYNLYMVVSDPLKVWSMVMIAITPGLRVWFVWLYLLYLIFEFWPWRVVHVPREDQRAPVLVWLFYPIYGAINTVLRFVSVFTWAWMRYVTKSMRPRNGAKDRVAQSKDRVAQAKAAALAVVLGALLAAGPAAAQTNAPRAGAQFRYWDFDGDNDNRNVLVYVVPGPWHAQLELWDFRSGEDQWRPELGGYVRDRRGSTYSGLVRLEGERRLNLEVETGQVVSGGFVARGLVRLIEDLEGGPTTVLVGGGADRYYGDYSFASASAFRDPRFGGRWTFTLMNRLAHEKGYVQVGITPAEARPPGYFVQVKHHWLVAGFEQNSRYDFSDLDNRIWTLGIELPLEALDED